MKIRLISLLLVCLMLCPSCALTEEERSSSSPYFELYPIALGDNAVFEVPNTWAYQQIEQDGLPPMIYIISGEEQLALAAKLPADWEDTEASEAMGLRSFILEGTAVMVGMTTSQGTRLREMTINDMPAVLVNMVGQGFDILWIGDSGDLYFFMFENSDEDFVEDVITVARSLCVFHLKDEQISSALDFTYTVENGEVTITEYIGESEHVLIPDTIEDMPVTALADSAFYEKRVTTVVVPDRVKQVGAACFSGDNYLVSLTLPENLEVLAEGCIESCVRLMDFELPQGLKKIEQATLYFNLYLTNLTLPAGLTDIAQSNFIGLFSMEDFAIAEGNGSFTYDSTNGLLMTADGIRVLHCFSALAPQSVLILPDGVKMIDPFAFYYDYEAEKIVLPEGTEMVGAMAFGMCPYLTEIVIPASVTSLGVMDGLDGTTGIASLTTNVIVTPEGSTAWNWALDVGMTVKAQEE